MKTSEISHRFQNYYQQRGHHPLPGTSLLHPSIPMSFVMSAGLVQIETSLSQAPHVQGKRYVLVQKCFRYFDIASVGQSDIHLSLFEMPGAFTFTRNGKSSTIPKMWRFVTEELGVDKNRLWVTYFGGGTVAGHRLAADQETYDTWRELGLPDRRLVALGPDDNYWKQGGGIDGQERYRKCGPNTEIFYDRGEASGCGPDCRPGCRCGRFIEFANSLFVRFELDEQTNHLRPMRKPFAETVVGAERLAAILQQKSSVFEIDSIAPLIETLRSFYNSEQSLIASPTISENIIADHLRALVFLVADGAPPPGKDGRQRLVKILIREMLTHAILLDLDLLTCLSDLIDTITTRYHLPQPHLPPKLTQYIHNEAKRFDQTLQNGQRLFKKRLRQNRGSTLSGSQIVELEKQAGFPSELIEWQLQRHGLPFRRREYRLALKDWKTALLSKLEHPVRS